MSPDGTQRESSPATWPTMRTTVGAIAGFGLRWLLVTVIVIILVVLALRAL